MKKSIIESINKNQSSLLQSISDKLDKSELKIIQQVKNIERVKNYLYKSRILYK